MLYDEATMTEQEMSLLEQEYLEQEMLEYGRLALYSDAMDRDIEYAMARRPDCQNVCVPMR